MTTNEKLPPINPDYILKYREDVFSTDTGPIVFRWPSTMTNDDLSDVLAWLEIMKRKMLRCVQQKSE